MSLGVPPLSSALPVINELAVWNKPWGNWYSELSSIIQGIQTTTFPTIVNLVDGATPALDASAGDIFRLSAAGDRTIAIPTNPTDGKKIIIEHTASGGARTLALNAGAGGFSFGSDITAITATSSGKTDLIGCYYRQSANMWWVIAYVKGY